MTKTETLINNLSPETKEKISAIFGSSDLFYTVCYLIAKNEHSYSLDKPDQWEMKLKFIHYIQDKIETFLDSLSLEGKEIMADIKSDYLEDFIKYTERPFDMTNDQFIGIIKHVQSEL